jgi:uncharacterized membrane protein
MLRGGIAAVLRLGTLAAVVAIGIGYLMLLASGDAPGTQPLLELLPDGGGGAVVGIGLFVLTVLPVAVLGVAAIGFWRRGERREMALSLLVMTLLVAGAVAGAIVTAG